MLLLATGMVMLEAAGEGPAWLWSEVPASIPAWATAACAELLVPNTSANRALRAFMALACVFVHANFKSETCRATVGTKAHCRNQGRVQGPVPAPARDTDQRSKQSSSCWLVHTASQLRLQAVSVLRLHTRSNSTSAMEMEDGEGVSRKLSLRRRVQPPGCVRCCTSRPKPWRGRAVACCIALRSSRVVQRRSGSLQRRRFAGAQRALRPCCHAHGAPQHSDSCPAQP